MEKIPLILLTNDDGITAPGLRTLIKVKNYKPSKEVSN